MRLHNAIRTFKPSPREGLTCRTWFAVKWGERAQYIQPVPQPEVHSVFLTRVRASGIIHVVLTNGWHSSSSNTFSCSAVITCAGLQGCEWRNHEHRMDFILCRNCQNRANKGRHTTEPDYPLLNSNRYYNNELWQTVSCIRTFQLHLPFLNDALVPLPIFNWLFMPESQPTTQVTPEQHVDPVAKGIICKTITGDSPSISTLINSPSM